MKKIIMISLLSIILVGLVRAYGKVSEQEDNPWDWPMEKIRALVGEVRAGKDLTPTIWPDGAKVAVALSFDFDAETNALRDKNISPGLFSQGEYAARVAVPRILSLLDKYNIPASFFVPAVSALLHPDEIKAIVAKGRHEIGMHGWIHERNSLLDEEEERRLMRQSYEILKKMTGEAPSLSLFWLLPLFQCSPSHQADGCFLCLGCRIRKGL